MYNIQSIYIYYTNEFVFLTTIDLNSKTYSYTTQTVYIKNTNAIVIFKNKKVFYANVFLYTKNLFVL